jgi:type IV pilus assembly protein PilW
MTSAVRSRLRKGFTLIEVVVALALTSIVALGIFSFYNSQNRAYVVQERVVEMQQNLRAGLEMLTREIRMAGYDPTGSASATITNATRTTLSFNSDIAGGDGDGIDNDEDGTIDEADEAVFGDGFLDDADENVTYTFNAAANELERDTGGGGQPVAQNIDALRFAYAIDSDGDGELDTDNGFVIWAIPGPGGTWLDLDEDDDGDIDADDDMANLDDTNITVDVADIRAVRIWMLARTRNRDQGFTDNRTYVVGDQRLTFNDHFRRRLLETTVSCRNRCL